MVHNDQGGVGARNDFCRRRRFLRLHLRPGLSAAATCKNRRRTQQDQCAYKNLFAFHIRHLMPREEKVQVNKEYSAHTYGNASFS